VKSSGGVVMALATLALAGCDGKSADPVTLYRNSPLDTSMRIHFATFDAPDGENFNLSNCQMAVRALNANVDALAKRDGGERDPSAGFWCEIGSFTEDGLVPPSFDSEWPAEVR